MISTYWEGDIPIQPLLFGVKDEGNIRFSLANYDVEPVLIDSDNRHVDVTGFQIVEEWEAGVFRFLFPTDRSVLTKHGDYMLQFVLRGQDGREQSTSPHTLRVRALGKRGRN